MRLILGTLLTGLFIVVLVVALSSSEFSGDSVRVGKGIVPVSYETVVNRDVAIQRVGRGLVSTVKN